MAQAAATIDAPEDVAESRRTGAELFARGLDRHLAGGLRLAVDNTSQKHAGITNLDARLGLAVRRSLTPPPKLSLSEWADKYAYLSPENSAEPGKWQTIGYQRGIMNAITDKRVETVSMMKSARVGYTKIIDHTIGYYAHQDPSPMMSVQPTIEDAKGYSTDEVVPMIRDTPALSALAISEKERGSGVTQLRRKFRNGASLLLVGANSPRGFRRVTVRVVLFDEVDGYPVEGAGNEGDQIRLGIKRTETFWNRKIIIGSTPTIKGASRIARSFANSDKRYFAVPCPHCHGRNILKFSEATDFGMPIAPPDDIKIAYMRWPKDKPELAYFDCGHCGTEIHEEHKAWMIEEATRFENDGWVATAQFKGHAGFHIWSAYSLFPNARWGVLASEFLEIKKANDNQALQVYINTVLGELWEPRGERVDDAALLARREDYGSVAPADGVVATAGVDVQGNRLEAEKVVWGLNGESWGMGKVVIYGDPTGADVWQQLDDYLSEPIQHELGFDLPVMAACIDSNYLTQTVCAWCQQRWGRRWWAIKGMGGQGRAIWPKKVSKTKGKLNQFIIGVDAAKELIYSRLRLPDPGAGYCHFNMEYDAEHFDQLTAEEVKVAYSKGLPIRTWELKPGKLRNEGLDIRVYALAALEGLRLMGLSMSKRKASMQRRAGGKPKPSKQAGAKAEDAGAESEAPERDEAAATPDAPQQRVKKKRKRRAAGTSSLMRR